MLFPAGTYAYT